MDFLRLQKALAFEAEAGFNDLQGNQYRFSEFLQIALGEPSPILDRPDRQKLQTLADKYSSYGDLEFADRQHLVAETRRTVYSLKQSTQQQSMQQQPAKDSVTKTIIRSTANSSQQISPSGKIPDLEQAVTYLPALLLSPRAY